MGLPLIPAGLIAVRIMGKGIQHLTKKQADKAVKEGWGSIVKPKKPYAQKRKEHLASTREASRKAAAKKKDIQKEHGKHIREGTDYASKQKRAWRNLTPAQRKAAGQSLANLEKSIGEATKAAKPVKAPSGQKGMYLPRKGETPSRKRGGVVKRKSGGKVMQGYKSGGKV